MGPDIRTRETVGLIRMLTSRPGMSTTAFGATARLVRRPPPQILGGYTGTIPTKNGKRCLSDVLARPHWSRRCNRHLVGLRLLRRPPERSTWRLFELEPCLLR